MSVQNISFKIRIGFRILYSYSQEVTNLLDQLTSFNGFFFIPVVRFEIFLLALHLCTNGGGGALLPYQKSQHLPLYRYKNVYREMNQKDLVSLVR